MYDSYTSCSNSGTAMVVMWPFEFPDLPVVQSIRGNFQFVYFKSFISCWRCLGFEKNLKMSHRACNIKRLVKDRYRKQIMLSWSFLSPRLSRSRRVTMLSTMWIIFRGRGQWPVASKAAATKLLGLTSPWTRMMSLGNDDWNMFSSQCSICPYLWLWLCWIQVFSLGESIGLRTSLHHMDSSNTFFQCCPLLFAGFCPQRRCVERGHW